MLRAVAATGLMLFGVAFVGALQLQRRPSRRRAHRHLRWVRGLRLAWSAELEVATELVLQCGEAILQTSRDARVLWKDSDGDGIDPCTATDENNEKLVALALASRFPEHSIVGEEDCARRDRVPPIDPARPTWVVDPIDGTQNFVHGLPLSVVSIGLCVDGQPAVGVVYDPFRDELFIGVTAAAARRARKGAHGAFLNGAPIRADGCATLSAAMVLTDPGYERSPAGAARIAGVFSAMLCARVRAVRALGSTVLSVCWVACGRASAMYAGLHEKDCPKPWDWCAAHAIASEAGVVFRRLDGDADADFSIECGSACLAGSEALAAELQRLVAGVPRGAG